MTFVGFDLHKRYITVCALSAEGEIIAEVRQLATSLEAILAWLALLPGPITVGVEATLYWEWLTTRLAARDVAVKVAHAFRVKLIWQARAKTDPIDARKLAELLRVNLLPAIWIPDAATRERRQLLRVRAFLVRERTQLKNRIHGHLTSENLVAPSSDLYGKGGRAWFASAPLSPVLRTQTEDLLTLHDALTEEITALDGDVKKAAKGNPVVKQLSSLPGVGLFGALLPCMDLDLEQRSQAVLHLPVATRAELASRLLDSLDSAETTESAESVAAAWDAELDRREADFGAAAGFGIPASEVFQRLDADLAALATHHETHR